MKFVIIALVASLIPSILSAPADQCVDQAGCIDFRMTRRTESDCNVGGDCTVEVCMIVNASAVNDTDGHGACPKVGSGTFSHMCSQSNFDGCAVWANDFETIPVMGNGTGTQSGNCSLTGEGDSEIFDGKCEGVATAMMCQEGKPGQWLYWILKDGNDDEVEPVIPLPFEFYWHVGDNHNCSAQVECFNNEFHCGNADVQVRKERTWRFRIPDGTELEGQDPRCNLCPPTPPPSPTGTLPPIGSPSGPTPSPIEPQTPTPGGGGDPHFKTWKSEHFQYHGQCDLVLVKDPTFADGLGIDIHIRTKLVRYWSYIKTAVIRIGSDILEIEGSTELFDHQTHYWLNYEYQADLTEFAGFPVEHYRQIGTAVHKNKIVIDLSPKYPGAKIHLTTFKEFIKVDFEHATEEAFGNSVGMLGDFKTGKTLARDGIQEFNDWTTFGREWQVIPTDGRFFRETSHPQFPEKCVEPEDPQGSRARRLGESTISMEQAEYACASIKDPEDRKDCIYDIVATQDLDMVGAF